MTNQDTRTQGGPVPSNSVYEIFILLIAVGSLLALPVLLLAPLPPQARPSLEVVGGAVSLVFLVDFLRSLRRAPDRWTYFKRWGWLDLLAAVPGVPLLHLARIGRIVRAVRFLRGTRASDVVQEADEHRAQSALLATVLVTIAVFLLASILIVDLETRSPEANILTAEDGMWWAFVTIATVGYGDEYPVTSGGRILGALVMAVGVGIFGVLTSYLAHGFLSRQEEDTEDELASMRAELAEIRRLLEGRQVPGPEADRPNGD
jgi:voltage-gated potassium channel